MSDLDNVLEAIARRGRRIDELAAEYCPPAHCCPSCASAEFRELVAKNERAAEWALRLISKAALVAYGRQAQELRSDYPHAWAKVVGGRARRAIHPPTVRFGLPPT